MWPVQGGLRSGVKPGRYLAKLGWSCKQVDYDTLRSYIHGSVISQLHYTNHVPIAYELNLLYFRVLRRSSPIVYTDKIASELEDNLPPVHAAYVVAAEEYGISLDALLRLCATLRNVVTFPVVVSDPLLDAIISHDL
jgi:hypothetical protein